jgi:hypothetical protein
MRTANRVVTVGFVNFNFPFFRAGVGGCPQNAVIVVDTTTLEKYPLSVEQEALLGAEFDTADAKNGCFGVSDGAIYENRGLCLVEMGCIRRP